MKLSMIKEERRPSKVSKLQASGLLGHRLEHEVCEGGAAFGCLAELATRRGFPLRPAGAPQKDLQSSPSSLRAYMLRRLPPFGHLLVYRCDRVAVCVRRGREARDIRQQDNQVSHCAHITVYTQTPINPCSKRAGSTAGSAKLSAVTTVNHAARCGGATFVSF